ncbi:MAG: hypothetical protein QXW97_00195 [Candidatus Pacearchaeota archaeon]
MYGYEWIINNKEILKIIYGVLIGTICLIIVLKTHKLYHFSKHEGIRYFRNAFMFYGIAFVIRYIFGGIEFFSTIDANYNSIIKILFEFFLIMGGFFLFYSLLWKRLKTSQDNLSSLLSFKSLVFYIMAFSIAILDYIWKVYYFLFFSQILLFACLILITYHNFKKDKGKSMFPKFYFIAMIIAFITWILNSMAPLYFNWSKILLIEIYALNIIVFLLFLYGVIRITKKSTI